MAPNQSRPMSGQEELVWCEIPCSHEFEGESCFACLALATLDDKPNPDALRWQYRFNNKGEIVGKLELSEDEANWMREQKRNSLPNMTDEVYERQMLMWQEVRPCRWA